MSIQTQDYNGGTPGLRQERRTPGWEAGREREYEYGEAENCEMASATGGFEAGLRLRKGSRVALGRSTTDDVIFSDLSEVGMETSAS